MRIRPGRFAAPTPTRSALISTPAPCPRLPADQRLAGRGDLWILVSIAALCVLYFLAPNPRLDFSAFDTRDAESYLALSASLVAGHGYTRNLDPNFYIPHTTWPPGLPLLLAPFTLLSGVPVDLLLIKLGMIAFGVCGIALAYLYARRMSPSPLVRAAVPLMLGLNPYYWQFSRMTNSEMPTVAWSLVALLLADVGWARGAIRHRTALAFGLVCGFGMLIRGSFYGALFLPLLYIFVLRDEPVDLRRMTSRYLCYAVGFLLPFAGWVLRNSAIDRTHIGPDGMNQLAMVLRERPVDPMSPFRSLEQTAADAIVGLEHGLYQIPKSLLPGLWAPGAWSALGHWSAPVGIALAVALVLFSLRTARTLPLITMYGSMAALNVFYAAGAMARLWIPTACLLAMSLPLAAERLRVALPRGVLTSLTGLALAALAASLGAFIIAHERHPYRDPNYAALADLFAEVRARPALQGNVLTPNPQAFQLYTGLDAPMSAPGIGVAPHYAYVILPSREWEAQTMGGRVLERNGVWSLVALATPVTLAEFREQYNCALSALASFAVVSNCLIQ